VRIGTLNLKNIIVLIVAGCFEMLLTTKGQ